MKKTLVVGLLATVVSTSCFAPVNTFAESKPPYSLQTNNPNAFNIDRISKSISALGSKMPLVEGYGLIIIKQPDLNVNVMSGITTDQSTAREHVYEWLDVYSPKLFAVNEDMQRFETRFSKYYDRLVELAGKMNEDSQAKAEFVRTFNRIQQQMEAIQLNMKQTSSELSNYNNKLVKNYDRFSNKVNKAIELYQNSNGDIQKLRTQIEKIDEDIQNEFTKLLNLPKENLKDSIGIGKKVFEIGAKGVQEKNVDVSELEVLINDSGNALNSKVQELNSNIKQKQAQKLQLLQKLSEIEFQVTRMTIIDGQLNNFTKAVEPQIQSFENIVSSWEHFNKTMLEIGTNLNSAANNIDSDAVKAQLNGLKKFTDELNKQTKEYEDSVTKIKVTE
ncbi:hemolytic enterotoxin [Bacillus cereus]|uniref:Hemolytic enterotoxin n=2 Tax=Bacillus cereus group TaxID=86661 RepID=A0A2A8LME9_BACCE|nr:MULTISPECIES: HBL/NHE enterotoxin family protein [Bacillus cereus group]MDR4986907.1 HBL/NHE enterotoxin family protein [Bacillus cereus]PES94579.1 hemolytic enterotoxin [Bacillus cereus]PFP75207.1 hemolytic enterotoxin [Bacillus cereus]